MTYPAFVLIRDIAEQLQAQKTSASASRQGMVTETPTLLDSKDPIILYTSDAQGFEFPETLPTPHDTRSNAKGKGRRKARPDRGNTLSGRRGRHAEDNEDSDRGETNIYVYTKQTKTTTTKY